MKAKLIYRDTWLNVQTAGQVHTSEIISVKRYSSVTLVCEGFNSSGTTPACNFGIYGLDPNDEQNNYYLAASNIVNNNATTVVSASVPTLTPTIKVRVILTGTTPKYDINFTLFGYV